MENYKMDYNVDMVFCIDTTGSMQPVINMVKNNALIFYNDVVNNMAAKNKIINRLRVRVVAFKDYVADHEKAMMVTDFFELPEQNRQFESCINSLSASGGGDEPEDGLEALAYAIKSPWNEEGMKKRNIIVIWSDASTHPLGFGRKDYSYPRNMAKDFEELTNWWGDSQNKGYINQSGKRLLMFTPDVNWWNNISENWDNVIHYPSEAGRGLDDIDYQQILNAIYSSI